MATLAKSFVRAICSGALLAFSICAWPQQGLRIGSNLSTESNVLAELIAQTGAKGEEGAPTRGLRSGDLIETVEALAQGSIDVAPMALELLARDVLWINAPFDLKRINTALQGRGLGIAIPLGFKRKYALAIPAEIGRNLMLNNVSELVSQPQLRYGFSPSFRSDRTGLAALKKHDLFLTFAAATELNLYERDTALVSGRVDVIDVLTTDSVIRKQRLTLLAGDADYFPGADVAILHRLDVSKRFPKTWLALAELENSVTENALLEINWRVDSGARTVPDAVADWLGSRKAPLHSANLASAKAQTLNDVSGPVAGQSIVPELRQLTMRHLGMVFIGLLGSIVIGVPLGIWASSRSRLGRLIMLGAKLIGITPFLALLALCVVLAQQFGALPAIIALFVYGLSPIVTHTYLGMRSIPKELIDAATLQCLFGSARLRLIELPLAMAAIGAGIRRCAVINVGTATLAALVGAGGYGQAIIDGIADQNFSRMLCGAIPAAVLAVGMYVLFGWIARVITPMGVQQLDLAES